MPVKKLKEFLDSEGIKYVSIVHSTTYTAQEVATSTHITVSDNEEIAFNAGSHTEVIKLAYKDFERLVKPKVVSFTT